MGMIPTDLDSAFDAVQVNKPIDDGKHTGTVVSAEVRESRKSWVDLELAVQLASDQGGRAFADIEISPLLGKDGQRSEGKLKFLKWQLQALGYDGSLSELDMNLDQLIGNEVEFEVTTTEARNINPNTGRPYMNRDVKVLNLIKNVNEAPVEVAVY